MEGLEMKSNREALILHYAAIATKELTETDLQTLESIKKEKTELERELGMNNTEIILAAKRLVIKE